MGVATTRSQERVLASLGKLGSAPIRPECVEDVPNGGVLCALPALVALGLLEHNAKHFSMPAGFYPVESVFLTLGFAALARVPSLECLRYEPQGEWGKLLGLDRLPEVKTLRNKVAELTADREKVGEWSRELAVNWMAEEQSEMAGTLYIDGHVRVYHGKLTDLPRRYVARQKLCLRGTTDYWVNAMDGKPFFVISKAVDPGLIKMLQDSIVPRLLEDVPGQPTAGQLASNRRLARFTLVFDRAGYSPEFFEWLWERRIAMITYRKAPEEVWEACEFVERKVRLVHGEEVTLRLAEQGVRLRNGFWVREIRSLESDGHQTSMVSTDYTSGLEETAARMFSRWCQENFFRYMAEHYGLNDLVEYGTEALPDTTVLVNPAWRRADAAVRREWAQLNREQVKFNALEVGEGMEPEAVARLEIQRGKQLERIGEHRTRLEELKKARRATPYHVSLGELPEGERFEQLKPTRKHFLDTIRLIAYRAETALVLLARESMARLDDARALVRQLFTSSVDLSPDEEAKTLTVRVHRFATAAHDTVLEHLCGELTATETLFPGTKLRLIFEPVGATQFPRRQES